MKIRNFITHKSKCGKDDSFVGIKIIENQIHFYYPETYHLDVENNDYSRSDIIALLKTISLAKTHSNVLSRPYCSHSSTGEFALNSYLWIIYDYLNNGFYNNREKELKLNQRGRVNWKKTLRNTPIISNGNVVYTNLIVEVNENVDSIIRKIHQYCVKKSIDIIGWLFNLNSKGLESIELNEITRKQYIYALKKELDKTFDDIKKLRFNHMMNILVGLDRDDSGKNFTYGVDNYYYIFERMINNIFGTENSLRNLYPDSTWNILKPKKMNYTPSLLRPDTIMIKNENAYILDSKYYQFGGSGNEKYLPMTSSIEKQVIYGEFFYDKIIKKENGIKNVYNAFIIPYDKKADIFMSNDDLQYIGYAKMNLDETKTYSYVYTFLIDLYYVVKTWNNSFHDRDIDKLVSLIQEVIVC